MNNLSHLLLLLCLVKAAVVTLISGDPYLATIRNARPSVKNDADYKVSKGV